MWYRSVESHWPCITDFIILSTSVAQVFVSTTLRSYSALRCHLTAREFCERAGGVRLFVSLGLALNDYCVFTFMNDFSHNFSHFPLTISLYYCVVYSAIQPLKTASVLNKISCQVHSVMIFCRVYLNSLFRGNGAPWKKVVIVKNNSPK